MSANTDLYVTLNDGSKMPQFMLGTPDKKEEYEGLPNVINKFVDLGFRGIDTAWYYGCEPYIGKALKDIFAEGKVKREDLFITTKVWPALWDRAEVSLKKSLSDMGVEYVDLVLHHWPVCFKGTDENGLPKVPRDEKGVLQLDEYGDWLETYKQLVELKKKGLAKSIGVSNYTEKHIQRAINETGVVPTVLQIELHPRIPSLDLIRFAESKGIKVESYSPLGHNGVPLLKEPLVLYMATKYGVPPAFILYAYHTSQGRIVITRTSKLERVQSFKDIHIPTLDPLDIAELDKIGVREPKRFINDDWGVGLGFEHWKEKYSWEE